MQMQMQINKKIYYNWTRRANTHSQVSVYMHSDRQKRSSSTKEKTKVGSALF